MNPHAPPPPWPNAHLADGSTRPFLEDGDQVTLRGWFGGGTGRVRIGFGECPGTVVPTPAGEER